MNPAKKCSVAKVYSVRKISPVAKFVREFFERGRIYGSNEIAENVNTAENCRRVVCV